MKLSDITGANGVEDITAPPSKQSNTSIAKITMFGIPLIPVLYVALLWIVNAVLPNADAERAKSMIDTVFPVLAAAVGGGGPLALFARSLMLTNYKAKAQLPATPDTVNAGGDVNLSSGSTPAALLQSTFDGATTFTEQPAPDWTEATDEVQVLSQ